MEGSERKERRGGGRERGWRRESKRCEREERESMVWGAVVGGEGVVGGWERRGEG